ncbi:EFR1 family ferrodoxin [Treponema socranskii]|uniref:4Fe-4S binding domain protein n=1 Tax=Treponema socranskii subsp. socranskii VPI DR56BR1116 = ATCC 35536 TaxID=1125725 RepID=U1GWL1_TRESO|nr:EFR1 family ferrodoxin [Treponema socranskii]ERF60954.1 4Fe-4S binding domain protein [Treponema socranskii subsp. socranskii VPI DR56BR1116 = ATCC 35536]ERK03807.1 4Fe-4S binding domain protein [Treponema socranskii subsp. socranskii VPI DR56BR1116 = ATCC 35536]MDR9858674.1 EFR1 family ferrodoxin [Treponema socranskii]
MNGIYFSGTGNTKYCTEALAQATGGRAYSMESREALEVLRASDEIALGYPIYFSDIPRIVKAFIIEHADMFCGKRVFIIATMGLFSGDGAGLASRLLRKCGAAVTGGLHLRMPDCIADVKLLKKTPEENGALIAAVQKKIAQTAEDIKRGIYPKDGLSFLHRIAGLFGQRLWFKMHAKKLRERLKIRTERCIGCGLCAANCPSKSLYIENNKAVFYPGNCTICYRCINNCPAKAITLIGTDVFEQCRFENYAAQ